MTDAESVSSSENSLRLRDLLSSNSLKHTMAQIGSLPSLPEIYQQLVAELNSPQSSLVNVARIIETDVGLTATVLKIANSAFYGLNQKVESVAHSVTLLGAPLVTNITLTTKVFSQFEGGASSLKQIRILNDQADKTGALANHFARLARLPKSTVNHTQVAGMLGNVGQLLGISNPSTLDTSTELIRSELMGAYLLDSWFMPLPVVEAVALQNEIPTRADNTVTPHVILHAIRYLEAQLQDVENTEHRAQCHEYLHQMVHNDIASQWLEAYSDLQLLTAHTDMQQLRAS